jgi:inner membrane protein
MVTPEPTPRPSAPRDSPVLKLLVICFLGLLLLIPTMLIQGLINEREATRNGAVAEVSEKWGGAQTIGGPVLTIPFRRARVNEQGRNEVMTEYAHFFPERLAFRGTLSPEKRRRSLYTVMLYNAQLAVRGHFRRPDLAALRIRPEEVLWNEAFLSLGLTDLKGIRQALRVRFAGQALTFEPGRSAPDLFRRGVGVPIGLTPGGTDSLTFALDLNLNGSSDIQVLPLGRETQVELTSPWSTPGFTGAFLPERWEKVPGGGFRAQWRVLHYNRNYAQQGIGAFVALESERPRPVTAATPDESGRFGVQLRLPVDEYQKTARSAKYSALFVLLTFTAFFFVEMLGRRRLHPIQYLLVGVAVVLFYILLLSISEYLTFDLAYFISGAIILVMVSLYTKVIFRSLGRALLFNGVLAVFYAFFYTLLQLEDYALLAGSLGLVAILGVIMYLTRHLDWYRAYGGSKEASGAVPQ